MRQKLLLSGLFLLLLPMLSGQAAWSQVPTTINYQGVLTDAGGTVVQDGNYNLTFRLYLVATGGTPLWAEAHTIAVSNGICNVILGSVLPLDLPFDRAYWLGVAIGTGSELTPRVQLTSSAYSLNARSISDNAVTASKIAGGTPGMEVSWQVTGIRQDPYANAHRIRVEEEKPAHERGYYLHPQAYGQPEERSIKRARK